jgi:predicted DNA-binding transcriptional regulator AlpA
MAIDKEQFQLPLTVTRFRPPKAKVRDVGVRKRALPERVANIDQVLSTHDVERITGRHRCTIYRWVLAGTFPAKRAGGGRGWLRSDVERWLQGATEMRTMEVPEL